MNVYRIGRAWRLAVGAGLVAWLVASGWRVDAAVVPQSGGVCAVAARLASARFGLPHGMLSAIGIVESGREDVGGGRIAWPYTVDADGAGHWFATEADAAAFVRTARAGGARAIDVGCFQIDLQQHPDAFANLRQAFDPVGNADYAAGFLTRLRFRRGSWNAAIAAYHSATPALGTPYARLVTAAWHGAAVTDPHVIRMAPSLVRSRGRLPAIVTP